jgi:carbonic anhydrase
MKFLLTLLVTLVPLTSATCYHGTSLSRRAAEVPAGEAPSFGYGPDDGPLLWHTLDTTANALCAHGTHQSPIDVRKDAQDGGAGGNGTTFVDGTSLGFRVRDQRVRGTLTNLGTTLQVGGIEADLSVDDDKYKLVQLHFHTPSEHTFEGEHYPMEVHFVFETEGRVARLCCPFLMLYPSFRSLRSSVPATLGLGCPGS